MKTPQLKYVEGLKFLPTAGRIRGHAVSKHILPFQRKILEAAFSGKNVFIGHSRKISKTLCFGWIAQALMDTKPGQTILCASATGEQASLVFNVVRRQIETNPKIPNSRYEISKDRIYNKETGSIVHRLHGKAMSALGLGPDVIICDEVGAWPSGELMSVLTSGMGMSEAPLILAASNPAPTETHWSVQWVLNLSKDPNWEVFDYGAGVKDNPFSEKSWAKGNPFLKAFFKNRKKYKIFKPLYEFFKKEAAKAKQSGQELTKFRRYLLGQKISDHLNPWISSDDLRECDESPLKNKKVRWIFACDLAYYRDFCAGVLCGYYEGKVFIFPILHINGVEKRTESQADMIRSWHRDGFVEIHDRPNISRDRFVDTCKAFLKKYKISPDYYVFDKCSVCADWHQDFAHDPVFVRGTPMEVSDSIRYLEARAKAHKIFVYKKNPCISWNCDNASVNSRSKNYVSLHKTDWRAGIDGMAAVTLATAQHLKTPPLGQFYIDVVPQPHDLTL